MPRARAHRQPAHRPAPATASAGRRASRGWAAGRLALAPAHATSAQLCALYPGGFPRPTGQAGIYLGHDRIAGGGFVFDLIESYRAGLVQGPHLLVSGAGAHGKSAIMKSYAYRAGLPAAARGDTSRFTAVIDPKGEWTPLARALGWTTLDLRPDGPIRINPLDPAPGMIPRRAAAARPENGELDDLDRRVGVVAALLTVAIGRGELSISEHRLVRAVVRRVCARTTTPTLLDVRALLAQPDHTLAADLETTPAELAERRRPLLDAAVTLVEHDLRGIADGPTSPGLTWTASPGLAVDLSALLTNRRALTLVLTAAAGWLQSLMYARRGGQTIMVIDEGWIALSELATVRFLQDQWRLGRQWGSGNILITHAIADLRSQVGDGQAQAHIAQGLLNTTSARVFLHQNAEHLRELVVDMGLGRTEARLLATMPPLTALWHLGDHATIVEHHLTNEEWIIADTDTAMKATPASGSVPTARTPSPR
jgi:hypothetical protein